MKMLYTRYFYFVTDKEFSYLRILLLFLIFFCNIIVIKLICL